MRRTVIGGVSLIGVGVFLCGVGAVWRHAYATHYTLAVRDILAGEPSGWLTRGPRGKRATVSGLALRSKAERITVQSHSGRGTTAADRMFFPLRAPDDNAALLVSVPREQWDDRILLSDTADQHLTFTGVLDLTPRTRGGQTVEQLFEGVRLPSPYCVDVGEEAGPPGGGWRDPRWLAVSGVALVVAGSALLLVRRRRAIGPRRGDS